jgi:hypothetical protein
MALTDNGIKVLDIAVKGVLGTIIAGLVAAYGYRLENQRAQVQADDARQQTLMNVVSHQKELDVDLGMRLFGTLMGYYFQKDRSAVRPAAIRQQMLLLRLVALNFQDVPIQLRPLFEDLDRQLKTVDEHQELRDIVQELARRQAFRLTIEGGYDTGLRKVKSGDVLEMPELLTSAKIGDVTAKSVKVMLNSQVIGDRSVGPFDVSYFDTPLTDNTKLGEYRFALMLLNSDTQTAEVRFVAFPKDLAADRFDITELSRQLRETVQQ